LEEPIGPNGNRLVVLSDGERHSIDDICKHTLQWRDVGWFMLAVSLTK
jgi:hypothetical protein